MFIHPASEVVLAGFQETHPPCRAAGFEAFVRLLLFFRRYDRLARVATFPDPGSGNELSAAAAALFGHGLL